MVQRQRGAARTNGRPLDRQAREKHRAAFGAVCDCVVMVEPAVGSGCHVWDCFLDGARRGEFDPSA